MWITLWITVRERGLYTHRKRRYLEIYRYRVSRQFSGERTDREQRPGQRNLRRLCCWLGLLFLRVSIEERKQRRETQAKPTAFVLVVRLIKEKTIVQREKTGNRGRRREEKDRDRGTECRSSEKKSAGAENRRRQLRQLRGRGRSADASGPLFRRLSSGPAPAAGSPPAPPLLGIPPMR